MNCSIFHRTRSRNFNKSAFINNSDVSINYFDFNFASEIDILTLQNHSFDGSSFRKQKQSRLLRKDDCVQKLDKPFDHLLFAGIRLIDRDDLSGIRHALHRAVDDLRCKILHLHHEKDRAGEQIAHVLRNEHGRRLHGADRRDRLRTDVEMLECLLGDAADVIGGGRQDQRKPLQLIGRDLVRVFA